MLNEGTDRHPKWYANVVYEVPVAQLKPTADDGELGVDHNVRQATDSDGEVYAQPDTSKLDANIKRKQRRAAKARERSRQSGKPLSNRGRRVCGQLRKLHRRKRRRRENAAHQHSRKMADTAHAVVVEALNIQAMTQSAKGTAEKPSTNVKAKSGLNREILASGWGQLERNRDYKADLGGEGGPGLHIANLCAVWTCRQGASQDPGNVQVHGLRAHCERRPQRRRQHSGQGTALDPTGPRGRGFCMARGVPVRDPDDP